MKLLPRNYFLNVSRDDFLSRIQLWDHDWVLGKRSIQTARLWVSEGYFPQADGGGRTGKPKNKCIYQNWATDIWFPAILLVRRTLGMSSYTWSRNASAIKRTENIFAALRTKKEWPPKPVCTGIDQGRNRCFPRHYYPREHHGFFSKTFILLELLSLLFQHHPLSRVSFDLPR